MSNKIVVLRGGLSKEREVSLVSGAACGEALRHLGYDVVFVDPSADVAAFASALQAEKPDTVFNALHGRWGEDGVVQGILDLMQIPYTHSGQLASAVAMNKPLAKRVFAAEGLVCPEGVVLATSNVLLECGVRFPYVVKPTNEGSSVGVKIISNGDDVAGFQAMNLFSGEVLVEQYIPGRELTVAVRSHDDSAEALGVLEIEPLSDFYDYKSKYEVGKSRHICPAPLPADIYQKVQDMAVAAHRALGCRGVSRADFRYNDTGVGPDGVYLLEVNTQPGMTPTSLVPEIAAARGIGFADLVKWMVEHARYGA